MAGGAVVLVKAVDDYLALRRAAGYELTVPGGLLRSFARFAASRDESLVCTETVVEWASQAPSLNQREHRLQIVIRFAKHMHIEDTRHEIPTRGLFRRQRIRRVPYIWTPEEANRLFQAAAALNPSGSLRPVMYSTLFALLYVSGLRISEALALQFNDFDSGNLTIRRTKFKKSRRIPLHPTAADALSQFIDRRREVSTNHQFLFISVRGARLDCSSVNWVFRRLLRSIDLDRGRHGRRPRIHDLRHTFATNTIRSSPEGRDEIGRHMLALSTYLGHARVSDTYWYLEATPELMQSISDSCEFFIRGGK